VLPMIGDHEAGGGEREHDQAQAERGPAEQQWPGVRLV
jgi:hypothetical protein